MLPEKIQERLDLAVNNASKHYLLNIKALKKWKAELIQLQKEVINCRNQEIINNYIQKNSNDAKTIKFNNQEKGINTFINRINYRIKALSINYSKEEKEKIINSVCNIISHNDAESLKVILENTPIDLSNSNKVIDLAIRQVNTNINSLECIKVLIDCGINVSIQNNFEDTLLHCASLRNNFALSDLLIDSGAIIDAKNKRNFTPLHFATHSGSLEVVKLLISEGANVKVRNREGNTPLQYSTHKRANLEVTQLLIDEGADVNNKNNVNETPLHWAVNSGNLDIAKILVDNGANLNEQTISGDTPLNLAIQNYREYISLLLINEGADPNIENNAGDAPLHIAAWNKNLKITEWLIKNGADVNKQDRHGNTPLHLAVRSDSKYVIDYLVKNSQCNFNIKNNIGQTPLELANYWCKTDIVSFLSSKIVKASQLKNQTEELTNNSFGQLEWVDDKPSGITWEFKETPNTFVKAKGESELNSQEKLHNKNLSFNEPQAGTSFDRSTIFKLEAETAKVAEQMLAQQAKERQEREKRQQEKEKRSKEKSQQEEPLSN